MLKCVIKARDPHLHRISVAAPGFLLPGSVPESTLTIQPILEGVLKTPFPLQHTIVEATSSKPLIKEEEEIVDVSESEGDFEVFKLLSSLEDLASDLGHTFPEQESHPQGESVISEAMPIKRKTRQILEKRTEVQALVSAPVWCPTMILDGDAVNADASIRNPQQGKTAYVADALEQSLLLPEDMNELRQMRKHEVFLTLKKELALRVENVFYPSAIRASSSSVPKVDAPPQGADVGKDSPIQVPPSSGNPPNEAVEFEATEKAVKTTKEVVYDAAQPLHLPLRSLLRRKNLPNLWK
ncbi:hypothetical protein SO802_005916 [Lithocarpus litseifolius]|uniref:Uncharacterized protein n=1 Tax=Lithocarpus litseifolius TaxID=425828 RepID=A0AAW2DMJ4_9ROSI